MGIEGCMNKRRFVSIMIHYSNDFGAMTSSSICVSESFVDRHDRDAFPGILIYKNPCCVFGGSLKIPISV